VAIRKIVGLENTTDMPLSCLKSGEGLNILMKVSEFRYSGEVKNIMITVI